MPTDTDPSPAVVLNRVTTHAQRLLDALTALDDAGGFRAAAAVGGREAPEALVPRHGAGPPEPARLRPAGSCGSCGENRLRFRHREARR
jgi:hypothetical protein